MLLYNTAFSNTLNYLPGGREGARQKNKGENEVMVAGGRSADAYSEGGEGAAW